jgi:Domain of unknown function (DUF4389)
VQPTPGPYPATLTFDPPEKIANWRPIVQWLLAIPHFIVLYVLRFVAEIVAIVSWFIVLFTGKLPEGIANLQAMYLRYQGRTYTYAGFMREEYPPFGFTTVATDPGEDPRIRVDIRPELENRNRLTVGFRIILAIPQLIVLSLLFIAAFVVYVIGFFAVLFTGRWPEGLRGFNLNVIRYQLRVESYLFLLTDAYPPFALNES